jgi:hypothetical protein
VPTKFVYTFRNITSCIKIKVKVHRKSLESPEWEVDVQLYTLLTSALEGGGCSAQRPGQFTPLEDPVHTVQEDWVGPRAGLNV